MVKPRTGFENWRGIVWALWSTLFACALSLSVRGASLQLDSRQVVFYRAFLGIAFILVWILCHKKTRQNLRFSDPTGHIIRGILMGVSTLLGFYALATVELAATTVLFGLAPVFATLFSVLFLGQQIGIRRSLAIVLGFIGALIIIDPRIELNIGMLAAVGASVMFGVALAMSRALAQRDGALSTLTSSLFITLLIAGLASIHVFTWPSGLSLWLLLLLLVCAGLFRQFADIMSYRYTEAAVLAPIFYLRLVLIAFGAYLLFGEVPQINTWIGAFIIIGSTVYMTLREARLAQKDKTSTPV